MILYVLRCTTPCAWMSESVRASCCARGRTSRSLRLRLLLMRKSRRHTGWDISLASAAPLFVLDRERMLVGDD
jgi:hypothetical protein